MLIANNIPYELGPSIQRFLKKKEVKTVFQFMLILDRPGDDHAFKIVLDALDGFG
jgi:superfamily I DNA/RNA helicase